MKRSYLVFSILLVFSFTLLSVYPASGFLGASKKEGKLEYCEDLKLGVRFLCDPKWDIHYDDNVTMAIISENPEVLMVIERTNARVRFLSEVNYHVLKDLDRYEDGFGTEHIRMAGKEALFVKAYAKGNPNKRLSDYFVVHDLTLYNVLFSVDPEEKRDDYKFLIKDIVDHFEFIPVKK